GGGSPFTRTTPWAQLRSLRDIGTLEYRCGFPGGYVAMRFSVPQSGGTVAAGVDVGGNVTSARVRPGQRFESAFGPPGAITWRMVRLIERGRVEATVSAQAPSAPPVGRSSCQKPKLVVFTVRPKGT